VAGVYVGFIVRLGQTETETVSVSVSVAVVAVVSVAVARRISIGSGMMGLGYTCHSYRRKSLNCSRGNGEGCSRTYTD
jgi:hypothetical protein